MKLNQVLEPEHILWNLNARNRNDALKDISSFLESTGMIRDKKEVYEKLLAREEILSTGIGNGVAIPHCKTGQVDSVKVALARSQNGVDFDAVDKAPAHLFFVVLSPPDQPNPHLQVLARISKILRTPGAIHHFMNASSANQLFEFINQEEKKIT
ncbi:MAG TPA: PTS sugar transporter subunit IIA [Thermoanaerobaculia bacterium]|nr:PTS sugar transporter subunit IIA [Thermoanaerobaculia bacterium]HUM29965.1 PTS sugar transporter subunit IIA [Thermoanaerobaculia bacterium]HXK68168.1 PTS sugar transporter subunit IIA [Thermoanaerobaculia bacterium]